MLLVLSLLLVLKRSRNMVMLDLQLPVPAANTVSTPVTQFPILLHVTHVSYGNLSAQIN